MLRAGKTILALAPLILVGYAACADPSGNTDPSGVAQEDDAAMWAKPPLVGTFRNADKNWGIAVLTLKTDYTYHKEDGVVCVRAPCIGPQVNGKYTFSKRDGMNMLVLLDASGARVGVYNYKVGDHETLYIAERGTDAWQTLHHSDVAWCAEPRDCGLQDLPVGICSGTWTCPENVCLYECGQIE